jgi:ADP-ribosylglycohydrolase
MCRILIFFILFISYTNQVLGQKDYEARTRGLLYGTLIGDALGGPIEFQGITYVNQTPYPIKEWQPQDSIDDLTLEALRQRLVLRPYTHLRPVPEPYGQWTTNALSGTVTDDSRNKMVLMHFLRTNPLKKLTPLRLANAYDHWLKKELMVRHPQYDTLNTQWLREIKYANQWLRGKRDSTALPPERMWNALPTCWGMMTTTPIAAIYPSDAQGAYLKAYQLAYFDHAFARDMNAAIVAGIAHAYSLEIDTMSDQSIWKSVINAMRSADPYRYHEVPWSQRTLTKWLDRSDSLVAQSHGKPYHLFNALNEEFRNHEKWEAHVVLTVCMSILKICNYDPLASMQLSIEWGWDTDTYPQLLGAMIGAIYGESIWKQEWKDTIDLRLSEDYDERIDEWFNILERQYKKQQIISSKKKKK